MSARIWEMRTMVWNPGQQLQDGKYTIERKLGEGGCGITYLALDRRQNRLVIKTLTNEIRQRPDFAKFQKDFVNEALKLARCNHPHIVKVEEVFPEIVPSLQQPGTGQPVDLWCMVMEYINGEDLYDRVIKKGAFSESEALLYIRQIGEALSVVVHAQGLLHRDVKPQNIMLNAVNSAAVLIDFGISWVLDPVRTQTLKLAWTPGFAPPEQYDPTAKLETYTDVYALAATLYYLLTGQLPTAAPARTAIPLSAPQDINSRISARVNQAILDGMELKIKDRPQSVQEWLAMLPATAGTPTPFISAPAQSAVPSLPPRYQKLHDLLAAGKWKDADLETRAVMEKVAGRKKEGWLNEESLSRFPCEDLRTIDQLWVKYSNGRFGFSVQKRIWQEVEGTPNADYKTWCQTWDRFGDRVGWRVSGEWLNFHQLTFNPNALSGHLPVGLWVAVCYLGVCILGYRIGFFDRVETCMEHFCRVETCKV